MQAEMKWIPTGFSHKKKKKDMKWITAKKENYGVCHLRNTEPKSRGKVVKVPPGTLSRVCHLETHTAAS